MTSEERVRRAQAAVPGWSELPCSDFCIEPLPGGLTNLLYTVRYIGGKDAGKASSPAKRVKRDDQDAPVALVRVYGEGSDAFMKREQEARIVRTLSDCGLCPQVFKAFDWGRVERFLPKARALTTREFAGPVFAPLVARMLGEFHLKKELLALCEAPGTESRLKARLEDWYQQALSVDFSKQGRKSLKLAGLGLSELREEMTWLLETAVANANSPVVFCHADLQEGNVLFTDPGSTEAVRREHLSMIDFEYGERMERGFDLGNCYCERTLDYGIKGYPGFSLNPDVYPSEKENRDFCTAYAEGAGLALSEVDKLMHEAKTFEMVSHFHWVLWSVIMASTSTIEWGYLEYATQRLDQYFALKKQWRPA